VSWKTRDDTVGGEGVILRANKKPGGQGGIIEKGKKIFASLIKGEKGEICIGWGGDGN